MRAQLRALLESGINPLNFFDRDYKKYFYLAGGCAHCTALCQEGFALQAQVYQLLAAALAATGALSQVQVYQLPAAALAAAGVHRLQLLKPSLPIPRFLSLSPPHARLPNRHDVVVIYYITNMN